MAAKQRKWKSKKNTVSSKKKKTHHPPTEPGVAPPDNARRRQRRRLKLRTANCEMGTGNYELASGHCKGEEEWEGDGVGTLQRLLSGARQRKAATIKILKIYHWKNGRKKRRTRTRNEVNSVHHFRGHVVFCFCFLASRARGEGGEVFALQTFLFNFSIFINFLA